MKTIEECRKAIDEIDDKIVELYLNRLKLVAEIGAAKSKSGKNVTDSEREQREGGHPTSIYFSCRRFTKSASVSTYMV